MIEHVSLIVWSAFLSFMGGPGAPYPSCPEAVPCASVNDLDIDGDVDLHDFAVMQNGWDCDGAGVCGYVLGRWTE